MGQDKSSLYLAMLKNLLKVQGTHISQYDLETSIETAREYTPWVPNKSSIDSDIWIKVKVNVGKDIRQGKKVPIRFWSMQAVIFTVFKTMNEDRVIMNTEQ